MITTSAVILAGGNSERMNFPKPYLSIGGKTFLERITKKYLEAGIREIYAVVNKKFLSAEWRDYLEPIEHLIRIVENKNPEFGKLHSLKLGIRHLTKKEYCFIQNVDNLPVSTKLISEMWKSRINEGVTIPAYNGKGGHPILISGNIINAIDWAPNEINLREFLKGFKRKNIETNNEKILYNINIQDDYQKCLMSFEPTEL